MMHILGRHSLERRAIEFLQGHYPVTARELAKALGIPERRMMAELRRMESRGLVELDVLPDTVFVRCLVVPRPRMGRNGGGERKKGIPPMPKKGGKGGDAHDPAYS